MNGKVGTPTRLVRTGTSRRQRWLKRQEARWAAKSSKVVTRQATEEERERYDIAR